MTHIRDMLFVNTLEKQIGRKLTTEELNSEEPFKVRYLSGTTTFIQIPLLKFPEELLSRPEDVYVPETVGLEDVA